MRFKCRYQNASSKEPCAELLMCPPGMSKYTVLYAACRSIESQPVHEIQILFVYACSVLFGFFGGVVFCFFFFAFCAIQSSPNLVFNIYNLLNHEF